MELAFLELVRQHEATTAARALGELGALRGSLLEVGAGAGWQSRSLAELGLQVTALDLPSSTYAKARIWPVVEYDGHRIPFRDAVFDLIFTNTVLEHVVALDSLLVEMRRVLKPGGLAVHLVPSPAWRLWTNLTYYPAKTIGFLSKKARENRTATGSHTGPRRRRLEVLRALLPRRHGEKGNAITEMAHFRRSAWHRVLLTPGWELVRCVPSGLLYSGNELLGASVPIALRALLSRYLGSACHLFVLRRVESTITGDRTPP